MSLYITNTKLEPTLKAWMQATLSPLKIVRLAYEPLFNKNRQSRVPQILHCSHGQLAKLGVIYVDELVDYTATHKKPNHKHENALEWPHYAREAALSAKLGEVSVDHLQQLDRYINAVSYVMGEYATNLVKGLSDDLTPYIEVVYKNSVTTWEEVV